MRESFCDGLGACIGACPTGALTIEQREAEDFDEAAVQDHVARQGAVPGDSRAADPACGAAAHPAASGCPGAMLFQLAAGAPAAGENAPDATGAAAAGSQLRQWPVQLSLVPPSAPFLRGADLLLLADCVPLALPDVHQRFLKDRMVLLACPKLDDRAAHAAKLRALLAEAKPKSLTVVRMEVPCCGGLVHMARKAVADAGSQVRGKEVVVGLDGRVAAENPWN